VLLRVLLDFLAGDDFLAVDFFAAVLVALLFAGAFLAVDFLAVDAPLLDFFAGVDFLAVDLAADDFFAGDDFLAGADFFAAAVLAVELPPEDGALFAGAGFLPADVLARPRLVEPDCCDRLRDADRRRGRSSASGCSSSGSSSASSWDSSAASES
jgi:hypothetical protein